GRNLDIVPFDCVVGTARRRLRVPFGEGPHWEKHLDGRRQIARPIKIQNRCLHPYTAKQTAFESAKPIDKTRQIAWPSIPTPRHSLAIASCNRRESAPFVDCQADLVCGFWQSDGHYQKEQENGNH